MNEKTKGELTFKINAEINWMQICEFLMENNYEKINHEDLCKYIINKYNIDVDSLFDTICNNASDFVDVKLTYLD